MSTIRNLLSKKTILSLLDCEPKSAQEISENTGELLDTLEVQLTSLASENICETQSDNEVTQWTVKKDIETFAQLVQDFISSDEPSEDEKSQFVTSVLYLNRIDLELVDFVIGRFHLDLVYRTDDEKEGLRRLLLASPSGVFFALHGDTTIFDELRSSRNQLDSSDSTREWFAQILSSQFQTPLLDMLIADMKLTTYGLLYAVLQLRVAKISTHVSLATPGGKYVEAAAGGSFVLYKAIEELRAGQLVSNANPMSFSDEGLAFLHLGEFATALDLFDKALNVVQDSNQKAVIYNNKGLAFLRSKQYQKAIECFDAGIKLDSGGTMPQLHENRQLTVKYLDRATDADSFTQPTQIRFVQGQPLPIADTRFYEFQEIKDGNPISSIANTSEEYAVAFLNRDGGRIFWGIKESDRITIGTTLNETQHDEIRVYVSEKLGAIEPLVSVDHWQLEFHEVYNLQGQILEDLWVVELVVPPPQVRHVFYTGSGQLFVRTDGGKKRLRGPEVTEFVRKHLTVVPNEV